MNRRVAAGFVAVAAVVVASCGGGGKNSSVTVGSTTPNSSATTGGATTTGGSTSTAPAAPASVTIHPLFVQGTSGGVGEEVVSAQKSSDGALRLDFSEDEPGGLGDQSRAASWNAVTTATLLSGAPLSGEYKFEIAGPIDGPSAGALKTVAIMSLIRGDSLQQDITMTGTINPDGTVGPVGGIPEKIQGAIKAGYKRILIPVGQRNTPSEATGQLVDVVALGERSNVQVTEADDIYEAYKAFTGKDLAKLPSSSDPRLDTTVYDRLQAQTNSALAKYKQSVGQISGLAPQIRQTVNSLVQNAQDRAARAADLQRQGLQGGAFQAAMQAALYSNAALKVGQAVQVYLTQGADPFFSEVQGSLAIGEEVGALLDTLKTARPTTVSDAAVLMNTYGAAFDALALSQFGENELAAIRKQVDAGTISGTAVAEAVLLPLLYYEAAGTLVDYASSIYEVGRDLGGPDLSTDVKLQPIADFFRKAADTNFAAFDANVVKSYANSLGTSEAETLNRFANADSDVALAIQERNLLSGLTNYIGAGQPNAEYAQLGFAITNFARNSLLVEKYYSNGQFDKNLNLTGVQFEQALSSGLDLAKAQVSSAIGELRDKQIEPAIEVASFEYAGVAREGDVTDKFDALSAYWSGFVSSRMLSYLGGFAQQGLTS